MKTQWQGFLTMLLILPLAAACGGGKNTTVTVNGQTFTRTFYQDVTYGVDVESDLSGKDPSFTPGGNCVQWVKYQPIDANGNSTGAAQDHLDFSNTACSPGGPAAANVLFSLSVLAAGSTGTYNLTAAGDPGKIEGQFVVNESGQNELEDLCDAGTSSVAATAQANCSVVLSSGHYSALATK